MNVRDVKVILNKLNISPKKHLGQNFLIDENATLDIIEFSDISKNDFILEVGPGLGALTSKLIENGKKVIAYEIDNKLFKFLKQKFSNIPNLELINQDILIAELLDHNMVVSNIPYSITGPLLEKLFFKNNAPEGNIVIEKNIADRIFYKTDYQNFSRITITVNSFMKPTKRKQISKNSFYPQPNIDLSLIKLEPKKHLHPFLQNPKTQKFFLQFIAGIMPYKNKKLSNSIKLFLKKIKITHISKEVIIDHLGNNKYINGKISQIPIEIFPELSKKIYNLIKMEN